MTKDIQESKGLALHEQSGSMALIADIAKSPGMTPEILREYIAANKEVVRFQAEIDFNRDRAAMQAELPVIPERHYNEHTRSWYAKIEDINETITPTLSKYGFSVAFENDFPENMVKVTAVLLHKNGHSARNAVQLPYDKTGAKGNINKTDLHAAGSSLTYAMRYAIVGLLNLRMEKSKSMDDDGNLGGSNPITESQREELQNLLEEREIDIGRFCTEVAKVGSLAEIPAYNFTKAKNMILARKKKDASDI